MLVYNIIMSFINAMFLLDSNLLQCVERLCNQRHQRLYTVSRGYESYIFLNQLEEDLLKKKKILN